MDSGLDDLASFGSEGEFSSEDNNKLRSNSFGNSHDVPSSPSKNPESPLYNPMGLTIGQISPGGRSFASDDRSSYNASHRSHESNSNFLVNAVHMHVQENAKIPNYNKAVDRSNSSNTRGRHNIGFHNNHSNSNHHSSIIPPPSSHRTSTDDHNVNNHDSGGSHLFEDFSMAELFLSKESSYRKSLNQTYEHVGSLMGPDHVTNSISESMMVDDSTNMDIDALTAAIDPTPWSEIEDKMHKEAQHHQKRQGVGQQQNHHQDHPHQSSYYPYGRHHQLPIPERIPSPPQQHHHHHSVQQPTSVTTTTTSTIQESNGDSGMAQALATAAALAAVSDNSVTKSLDTRKFPPSTPAALPDPLTGDASKTSTATDPAAVRLPYPSLGIDPSPSSRNTPTTSNKFDQNKSEAPQHLQRQRANSAAAPTHAAAHSTNRASVLAAASQKSQYGFGGNHMVPSVPAPPPSQHSRPQIITASSNAMSFGKSGTSLTKNSKTSLPPQLHSLQRSFPTENPQTNNSGVAYERKKQRAKDARIKLNDSIDRLSIAISLAGSQSAERTNQLQNTVINTNHALRQRTLQSNQECLNLAEQAKKWDRPSFVGTAASLIQSLNGQCEALMAELLALQQRTATTDGQTTVTAASSTLISSCPSQNSGEGTSLASNHEPEPSSHPDAEALNSTASDAPTPKTRPRESVVFLEALHEPLNKRARVDESDRAAAGTGSSKEKPSDEAIVLGYVSRYLDPRSLCRLQCVTTTWKKLGCLCDDSIWLNLLIRRFGIYNVRQWKSKMKQSDDDGGNEICNKLLYKNMHAANVAPHFQQQAPLLKLGQAMIQGKVSGWLFLVERSNGETLRSVKCQPGKEENGRTYESTPVVELKVLIQNTGLGESPVVLKDQALAVDVSTRRTGGSLVEISWDDRFRKTARNLDGTRRESQGDTLTGEICSLSLFEAVVLDVYILAEGCTTTAKFRQKGNFAKLLVTMDGRTVTMVIPFSEER